MTGKQALYDLIDEIKYTHNDGVSLTQFDQKRVDAIMKDLEVNNMKDYKLSEIKAICEKHESCNKTCPFYRKYEIIKCIWLQDFMTKEEFKKIKEWLEEK